MLNKVLIYFQGEEGLENLLEYGKMLQERYGIKIGGIYVKDIRKYEMITPAVEGVVVDSAAGYAFSEWESIEKKNVEAIKEKFCRYFDEIDLFIADGITTDCVISKLKAYDILMLYKGERVGNEIKAFMKAAHKPLILMPKKKAEGIEKVLFANDGQICSNKSVAEFIRLFGHVKEIASLEVGVEEDEETGNYIRERGLKLNVIRRTGDASAVIVSESMNYDFMIMGNLRHFFLFEKLIGKTGITILEKIQLPIFVG